MSETHSLAELQALIGTSLLLGSGQLVVRRDGTLQYDGERPAGGGWHAHGWFPIHRRMLREHRVARFGLHKRRWKDATERGRPSCRSRPDDDLPSVSCCALIVVLCLWSWLDARRGLLHVRATFPGFDGVVSTRTVQRWMRRARQRALLTQQAIREAVIERSEPRPVEQLFEGGLPPPERMRRRWKKESHEVGHLWTAFTMLLGAAAHFEIPVPVLLAEARRRWATKQSQFLI